ncbi:MAG TPA: glycosyltransferase [Nitrospirae bacterium]|nr:glycosyltransferase [Nitrospirota bacterium]
MTEAAHFISIIIPVYNGGKTIGRCLESIFKSTYPSYECVVVDDRSNDDTHRIIQSFDARIIQLDGQRGAAYARNRGAEAARGDILLFIDADVTIYPDCLDKVARLFEANPGISALFGTYDDQPDGPNFLSQYKNLFHHFVHQTSGEDASTFWTACGAIKKDVFFEVGEFNEETRMMEDIELGYKLKAKNHKIRLDKGLVVKHLKRYSFSCLLKSDLFDRAIPWTILILNNKQVANDLNLKTTHKLSALVVIFLVASVFIAPVSMWFVLIIPVLLTVFFLINHEFYGFYFRKRGSMFTLKVIPLHILYYLYGTLGFMIGHYKYYLNKRTS